jgi:uncharacterized protein YegJ (DUF2314 family)
MVAEFLNAIVSWETFLVALLVFGFAPGAALRLIVLAFHRDDPRRSEMLAELHPVPRWERPFWVVEQLEVALFEGIWERALWAGAGRIYDRWHLESGVRRNREHPETFEIPNEDSKQAIEPEVFVKLMFDTSDILGRRNWGERMWVEVVDVRRRRIVGELRNEPIGIPRLYYGDRVKFKHEHIIDIDWEPHLCDCELAAGDPEHHHTAPVHEGCNGHHEPMAGNPDTPPLSPPA